MKKLFASIFVSLLVVTPAFAQSLSGSVVTSGTATAAVASCPQFSLNLYMGARDAYTGGQVTTLQQFLKARYGNQLVTGYFGSMTAANVSRLQQDVGVSMVGGMGPLTRAAILRLCNTGGTPQPTTGGLSANPSTGNAPLAVNFTATVPDANQYIIEFGDGANSGPIGGGVVTHTYANAGTYTASLSRYISCVYATPIHCMIAVMPLATTTVQVNAPTQASGLQVTSPTAGQTYARGADITISWSGLIHATFAAEQDSSVVDLYTVAGAKVGTIAIADGISGSHAWKVPPFPNNLMCTMQFPNGLCGQNLQPGQYYIKVTAVVGNGFDTNATALGTAQSGVFSIQ